jgi:hypothetical protein
MAIVTKIKVPLAPVTYVIMAIVTNIKVPLAPR